MSDLSLDLIQGLPYRRTKPADQLNRKKKGKFDYGEFITWDGEGITTDNGQHHYCLLANNLGLALLSPYAQHSEGELGLLSLNIFEALIDAATKHPNAIHVIYYGGYDFNKWLKDLSPDVLERLRRGDKAYYYQYNIEVRFGKRFWIRDRNTGVSCTVWDVGSFFQQSFVKSLETWETPTEHLETIKAQKQRRSVFTFDDIDEIKQYCFYELESLTELMKQFRDALAKCNLRISQWHGPGAIAEKLFSQHNIKRHKTVADERVNRAAQYAYGGGRIEKIKQGHHTGRTYYYDVRSCYPAAIAKLPSLSNCSWRLSHNSSPEIKEFSLYRVRWDFPGGEAFYPTRHRYANGNVCYPQKGIGTWIWTPEYELLCDYFPGCFETEQSLLFVPASGERPFSWVEDHYYQRQDWKRKGYGAERILKLGLNSLYGKMIQQLGWKTRDQLPAYHQLEWGGYVTSTARAQLFRAAYGHDGIIGFETDGLLSKRELPVALSDKLGDWEVESYNGATYVQTGFYWLDTPTGEKVKYRGFDPGSIHRSDVLACWRSNTPTFEAKLTRFIGLNYAMHTGHMEDWGNWVTSPRSLDVGGASTKRIHICDRKHCSGYGKTMADCLHDTQPYGEGVEFSEPYPLEWKEKMPEWKIEQQAFDNELVDYYSVVFS